MVPGSSGYDAVMENTFDTPFDRSPDSSRPSWCEYEPTPDALTMGAYYSFIDHGSLPGHDLRDWLETESWLENDNHLDRRAYTA